MVSADVVILDGSRNVTMLLALECHHLFPRIHPRTVEDDVADLGRNRPMVGYE